jgi:hypothetical protein
VKYDRKKAIVQLKYIVLIFVVLGWPVLLCFIDCPLFIDLWMIFFVPHFPDFQSFTYLDKDSFGGGI